MYARTGRRMCVTACCKTECFIHSLAESFSVCMHVELPLMLASLSHGVSASDEEAHAGSEALPVSDTHSRHNASSCSMQRSHRSLRTQWPHAALTQASLGQRLLAS